MENLSHLIIRQICEELGSTIVVVNLFLTCRKLYSLVEIRKLHFEFSKQLYSFSPIDGIMQQIQDNEWNSIISGDFFIKHIRRLYPTIFWISPTLTKWDIKQSSSVLHVNYGSGLIEIHTITFIDNNTPVGFDGCGLKRKICEYISFNSIVFTMVTKRIKPNRMHSHIRFV